MRSESRREVREFPRPTIAYNLINVENNENVIIE